MPRDSDLRHFRFDGTRASRLFPTSFLREGGFDVPAPPALAAAARPSSGRDHCSTSPVKFYRAMHEIGNRLLENFMVAGVELQEPDLLVETCPQTCLEQGLTKPCTDGLDRARARTKPIRSQSPHPISQRATAA